MEHITPCLKPTMSPRCHAQPPPPGLVYPFSVPFQFLPSQAPLPLPWRCSHLQCSFQDGFFASSEGPTLNPSMKLPQRTLPLSLRHITCESICPSLKFYGTICH